MRSLDTRADYPDGRHVAVVVRVSTDAQDTARQHTSVAELARHHFPDAHTVEYVDDGVSAYHNPIFDRPAGKKLIAAIQEGKVLAVLADAQDRLSRGRLAEWALFADLCREAETRIITGQEGEHHPGEFSSDLTGALTALLARKESSDKSHRVKGGKRAASAQGYWPHGKTPLGYVAAPASDNPARKVLAVDPQTAPLVQEAARRFDEEHATLADTTRYLNANGVEITRKAVKLLLRSPAYLGKVPCNNDVFDGRHEALIDEARHRRIQRRLEVATIESHRPPKKWPFARIARCPTCGYGLRYRSKQNSYGSVYHYALCNDSSCPQPSISATIFEANFALSLAAIAKGLSERLTADPRWALAQEAQTSLAEAHDAAEEAKARLDESTNLILDGALSRDDARYRDALAAHRAAQDLLARLDERARTFRDELAELAADVEALGQFAGYDDDLAGEKFEETVTIVDGDTETSVTILHTGGPTLQQMLDGWRRAPLERKRMILERTFSKITPRPDGIDFDFKTALPETLTLPALVRDEPTNRKTAQAEVGTKPR